MATGAGRRDVRPERHLYFLEPDASGHACAALTRGNIMQTDPVLPATMLLMLCAGISSAHRQRTTWKDYLGGPDSSHYSALKQINPANVDKLEVAWSYPTGDDLSYTFSPLVVDNVAFLPRSKARWWPWTRRPARNYGSTTLPPRRSDRPFRRNHRRSAAPTTGRVRTDRTAACSSPRRFRAGHRRAHRQAGRLLCRSRETRSQDRA